MANCAHEEKRILPDTASITIVGFVNSFGLPLCDNDDDCVSPGSYAMTICYKPLKKLSKMSNKRGVCAHLKCPHTGTWIWSFTGKNGRCSQPSDCAWNGDYRNHHESINVPTTVPSSCTPIIVDQVNKATENFCCIDPRRCPTTSEIYNKQTGEKYNLCISDADCPPHKGLKNPTNRDTIGVFCDHVSRFCCAGELQCPQTPFLMLYQPKCTKDSHCHVSSYCYKGRCCPNVREIDIENHCSQRICPKDAPTMAILKKYYIYCNTRNFLCIAGLTIGRLTIQRANQTALCDHVRTCASIGLAQHSCFFRSGNYSKNVCVKNSRGVEHGHMDSDNTNLIYYSCMATFILISILTIGLMATVVYLVLRRTPWKTVPGENWEPPKQVQSHRSLMLNTTTCITQTNTENKNNNCE